MINRYPTDTPPLAEETSPRAIEKWGKTPILCIVPDAPLPQAPSTHPISPAIESAIGTVDWLALCAKVKPGLRA